MKFLPKDKDRTNNDIFDRPLRSTEMDRTIELTIALLLAAILVCDRAYVWELSSYSAHENSQRIIRNN